MQVISYSFPLTLLFSFPSAEEIHCHLVNAW